MNGLLLIDKPAQYTSHDVVARVRHAMGIRAVGHAGTLDPFATGLLILCIGQATRLSEYLIGEDKAYRGRMKLGERTRTDDLDGEVIERRPVRVSPADLQRASESFTGEILQKPPSYSAIQIHGKRAYKLARQGEVVDLPARTVRVEQLELAQVDDQYLDIHVTCSAGTYIRALARDIGEMLGCGAHLTALRRERSGDFALADAVPLEVFLQSAMSKSAGENWPPYLLPMDRAVHSLSAIHLDELHIQHFLMGQAVAVGMAQGSPDAATLSAFCRVYDPGGTFVAIGKVNRASGVLSPYKVFQHRQ